jgi:Holliday junction resolvase RusA-like endonuclease
MPPQCHALTGGKDWRTYRLNTSMYKVNIKPLSVNEAYKGRRFSTDTLKKYKQHLSLVLPKKNFPKGKLSVVYRFGVSSKGADGDNLIKAFQDCLSEQYGFNDNKIYKWVVEKVDTKKGEEFVEFDIQSFE